MAVKKKPAKAPQKSTLPTELVLNLSDPSLCGSLRAGLGGLAAAIRFIGLEDDPKLRWPAEVPIGKGVAVVEPDRILLRWGAEPEEFLTRLFARSFRLRESEGLIDIAGTYEYGDPPSLPVASAIQDAYRLTMLQHGKMATKRGKPALRQWSDGDREITVEVQGYESFIQQSGVSDVLKSLKQPIQLAGWAVSGGAQRHIAFGATKLEYGPVATLAAYFTIAGTLSLAAPGKRGAFVVLEPADLQAFARLRPRLSARRRVDAFVLAAGDALLQVLTMPRMEEKQQMLGSAVRSVEACVLALLPWASQQKSRTRVIRARSIADSVLDQFDKLARQLPNRVRVRKGRWQLRFGKCVPRLCGGEPRPGQEVVCRLRDGQDRESNGPEVYPSISNRRQGLWGVVPRGTGRNQADDRTPGDCREGAGQ